MRSRRLSAMRRSMIVVLLLATSVFVPSGCTSYALTADERADLERLEAFDIKPGEAAGSPPRTLALANAWGPLGLLLGPDLGYFPLGGTANFFLAEQAGGDSAQWWLGVMNSVTWPVSAIWSIPQVVNDAAVLNQRDTIFFYRRTLRGAAEWQRRAGRTAWLDRVGLTEEADDDRASAAPPSR